MFKRIKKFIQKNEDAIINVGLPCIAGVLIGGISYKAGYRKGNVEGYSDGVSDGITLTNSILKACVGCCKEDKE